MKARKERGGPTPAQPWCHLVSVVSTGAGLDH